MTMVISRRWQSRYVAYATAHGRTPEEQLAHDDEVWPGGHLTGYMLWIQKAWRTWEAETGEKKKWGAGWSDEQHAKFDQWLKDGHANTLRV